MKHVRATIRLACVAVWTLACFATWLATRPLVLASRDLGHRTHAGLVRAWARGVARVLHLEIAVEGAPPRAPFFLAANHLSYLDVVALWCHVDAVFLAKSEVARWPVIGFLARSIGTRFIDRAKKSDVARVVDELARALEDNGGVIVFPEGTSSAGERVLPFRPSIFEVAAASGTPVCCASISYATPPGAPPASSAVCWWGDMTFGAHVYQLFGLPFVRARLVFAGERIAGRDRKHLAARAHAAISARLQPIGAGAT